MSSGTRIWLRTLLSVLISGAAGGLLLVLSEAQSLEDPWKLAKAVLILTLISVANFLKQSPLPPPDHDQTPDRP